MANQDLERILEEEYKRLAGERGSSKSTGLLDLVSAPLSPTPARPASSAPKPAVAPVTTTSSTINKGQALPAPPSPQPSTTGGSSIAGEIGKTTLKMFTSGLGVMPLISGLAGLFGGGGESPAPAPLVKYAMPRSIQIAAANSRNGGALSSADYNQEGTWRSFGENSGGGSVAPQSPSGSPAGQIVVNVQAMDSRSFLDHSQEIAQAVREAMLNMHALNDVVSEL